MRQIFVALGLCFSLSQTQAQTLEMGLMGGVALPAADVKVYFGNAVQQMRPAVGVFVRHYFNPTFSLRGQITTAQLYGNEKLYGDLAIRRARGFSFKTSVTDFSLTPEIRFAQWGNIDFLAFAGGSVAYFLPKTDFNEPNPVVQDANLIQQDKNADFSKIALSIVGGVGVQWYLTEQSSLGLLTSFYRTNTDYLDGISKTTIGGGYKDYYFTAGFTYAYSFDFGSRGFKNSKGRRATGGRQRVNCPTF